MYVTMPKQIKGLGTVVLIGAGLETSGVINYIPLLCGRVLKGSIYGGVRPLSDLPTIIDKCIKKVKFLSNRHE